LLLAACGIIAWWGWSYWREHRFDAVIAAAASRYQLDPALVKAVVWEESRFNPDVRGRVGEMGLMQVRTGVARDWAGTEHLRSFEPEACFNPATNTLAGAWYLKKALHRYSQADNPLPYALAEYNAGRGNVVKWLDTRSATNSAAFLGRIGFPSTRLYVMAVMERYERYRRRVRSGQASIVNTNSI
jgi:soluble lytic murein transglycosylase